MMLRTLLLILCTIVGASGAVPAFTDFYGTNNIKISTNGNKVQIDGSALQPGSTVLSNAVGTGILTNASDFQPASIVLSNAVGTGILTNASAFQPASSILSNAAVTGVLTNANGLSPTLSTNQTDSSLTNHVVDFDQTYSVLFATNDVNFVHSTNRVAGVWRSSVLKVYAGETNRQIWLNSAWSLLGTTATSMLLNSNTIGILSVSQDGTSETNVVSVWSDQP